MWSNLLPPSIMCKENGDMQVLVEEVSKGMRPTESFRNGRSVRDSTVV